VEIEKNTQARLDMEYSLRVLDSYLRLNERSERMRNKVEHEKRNLIYTSDHLLLCLENILITTFSTIFTRIIVHHSAQSVDLSLPLMYHDPS